MPATYKFRLLNNFLFTRGVNSKKSKVFRECYGRLAELRSLLKPIPFVALTATASKQVQSTIIKYLAMIQYAYVGSCPDRKNIKYSVIKLRSDDINVNLKWLIDELRDHGKNSEKCIIFCRSHKTVSLCFSTVLNALKEKAHIDIDEGVRKDYKTRIIAMFHSDTDQDVKDHVIKSFSSCNGTVRVVFATIAFGMGVDCKGLTTVVHYGPPDDIDDYFQESGRAGRDTTSNCHAVLLLYPKCLSSKLISPEMKDYCKNETNCRRAILLRKYVESFASSSISEHNCCDICSMKCQAGLCENEVKQSNKSKAELYLKKQNVIQNHPSSLHHAVLTRETEDLVRKELEKVKLSFTEGNTDVNGCDVSLGFPKNVIDEVVNSLSCLTSVDAVWKFTSVLDWHICQSIFETIQQLRQENVLKVCTDSDNNDQFSDQDDKSYSESTSGSSESSDCDVDINYGIATDSSDDTE